MSRLKHSLEKAYGTVISFHFSGQKHLGEKRDILKLQQSYRKRILFTHFWWKRLALRSQVGHEIFTFHFELRHREERGGDGEERAGGERQHNEVMHGSWQKADTLWTNEEKYWLGTSLFPPFSLCPARFGLWGFVWFNTFILAFARSWNMIVCITTWTIKNIIEWITVQSMNRLYCIFSIENLNKIDKY